MQGKVKFFDSKKGFGFITGMDGKDIFFHHTKIDNDYKDYIQSNDNVSFEVFQSQKGNNAKNIKKL